MIGERGIAGTTSPYRRSVATIQGAWCSKDCFSSPPLFTEQEVVGPNLKTCKKSSHTNLLLKGRCFFTLANFPIKYFFPAPFIQVTQLETSFLSSFYPVFTYHIANLSSENRFYKTVPRYDKKNKFTSNYFILSSTQGQLRVECPC